MYEMIIFFLLILSPLNCKGNRVRRIVGGEPAKTPPIDDPVVYTRFDGKSARIQGVVDLPHYVFKGIRFGYAPTGKDRFVRPRQYLLNGFENATSYPPSCIQTIPGQDKVVGQEDCLFLNVYTPNLPTGMEGLPVVVWIHGGGFRTGSASQYGAKQLVGKQIIVVTIQYRLGSLGFLSTGTKDLPGNAALWDMVLAVQWTRNYIGFFGGNPHKIVVMGHGSGASSAMMVSLNNVAKGLTSGIVAMSGSSLSHFSLDETPQNSAKQVADLNGCPTGSALTMVRCLQNLKPEAIIKNDDNIQFQRIQMGGFVSGMSGRSGCAPVNEGLNDGRALPGLVERQPMEELSRQDNDIPVLTGVTKDETKRAVHSGYKEEILDKLKSVPNFLEQVFVKDLQKTINFGNFQNKTNEIWKLLDPLQFQNYLKVTTNDFSQGLLKISEATADALFNVPAFMTVELWTKKKSPAYLYRFEHIGKLKKGNVFLKGLPIVGNLSNKVDNDMVSHGDELAYLFDPQDLNGRPLTSGKLHEDDVKVRNVFTQFISDFVRYGKAKVGKNDAKPFSNSDNNFIQIGLEPKVANNFRFCEIALWCGLAQRLQSSTCSLYKVLDSQLKNVQQLVNTNIGGLTKDSSANLQPLNVFNINNPNMPAKMNQQTLLGRKLLYEV